MVVIANFYKNIDMRFLVICLLLLLFSCQRNTKGWFVYSVTLSKDTIVWEERDLHYSKDLQTKGERFFCTIEFDKNGKQTIKTLLYRNTANKTFIRYFHNQQIAEYRVGCNSPMQNKPPADTGYHVLYYPNGCRYGWGKIFDCKPIGTWQFFNRKERLKCETADSTIIEKMKTKHERIK